MGAHHINITEENPNQTAFIGNLQNGVVKNLTVEGEITTEVDKALGGIVGVINNSTIDNCVNEVTVTNKVNTTSTKAIGGIIGWSTGTTTIKKSINKANISGGFVTGGIIASNQGGTLTIENCKNYGTITNEIGIISAGLVGEEIDTAQKTIIKNSTNYGEIIGKSQNTTKYLGGLIGRSTKELEIDNSNNEGKITINLNSSFYAGGLVGYVTGKVNINNSHNKNTITSNKTDNVGERNIGGLVGCIINTQTSTITNSSNEKSGVISGGNRTGGLIGECHAGLIMNNCYNLANISSGDTCNGSLHIGGLSGAISGWSIKHEDIVIINSYNKGNIDVSVDNYNSAASGLIGTQIGSSSSNQEDTSTNTKIINSYNQGSITMNGNTTDWLRANGILQISPKSVTLNNVYNVGTLNSKNTNNVITNNNSNVTTNYKNVYYLSSLTGTLPDDITNVIGKTADEMKNNTFVTLLNTNKSSITLTDIDSRLSGYTLCDWKLGTSGYPELDCK